MPECLPVHAILDNYAVHKHSKVRAGRPAIRGGHSISRPPLCSWANAVENFFATLTRRRLQRGVFHSLVDLQAAINRYLSEHNRRPTPFVWSADPDRIIEKVNRGYQTIASNHQLPPPISPDRSNSVSMCRRLGIITTLPSLARLISICS